MNCFYLDLNAQPNNASSISIPIFQSHNLIQGRLYIPEFPNTRGSQFLTKSWVLGEIKLLGKSFTEVPVWYDIQSDDLVLMKIDEGGFDQIALNTSLIHEFRFANRQFINLYFSPYAGTNESHRFFEVLIDGTLSLLVKRKLKRLLNNSIATFKRDDEWYLGLGNRLYRISGKKDLFDLFGQENKKAVKQILKKRKMRFSQASNEDWIELTKSLESLMEN